MHKSFSALWEVGNEKAPVSSLERELSHHMILGRLLLATTSNIPEKYAAVALPIAKVPPSYLSHLARQIVKRKFKKKKKTLHSASEKELCAFSVLFHTYLMQVRLCKFPAQRSLWKYFCFCLEIFVISVWHQRTWYWSFLCSSIDLLSIECHSLLLKAFCVSAEYERF